MELQVNNPDIRTRDELHFMAIAVQANVVQLKIAENRFNHPDSTASDLNIPSPGAVKQFRDTLITPEKLKQYSVHELHFLLHKVWGQYCMLAWIFQLNPTEQISGFAELASDKEPHCETSLIAKETEINATMWRLGIEQKIRENKQGWEPNSEERKWVNTIPAIVFGKKVSDATDDEILLGSCELAGAIQCVRWAKNSKLLWNDPALLQPRDRPF